MISRAPRPSRVLPQPHPRAAVAAVLVLTALLAAVVVWSDRATDAALEIALVVPLAAVAVLAAHGRGDPGAPSVEPGPTRASWLGAGRRAVPNRIHAILEGRVDMRLAYQPIVDLTTGELYGVEALARFTDEPADSPLTWFEHANRVGLGRALELHAVKSALATLPALPPNTRLAINVSPQVILDPRFTELLDAPGTPLNRLAVEITEHVSVGDYSAIRDALEGLRRRGLRLAVDDAGAGFASFGHILELRADTIKLDRSLIHGIDQDAARRAFVAAIVVFALEIGTKVIAEGVESAAELDTVRTLGVDAVQGYHVAPPTTADAVWEHWRSPVLDARDGQLNGVAAR